MQANIQIKYTRDPATGDLVGQVTVLNHENVPVTLSARANEKDILNVLVKRFGPQIQAFIAAHQAQGVAPAAISGSLGSFFKKIGTVAKKVAHGKIFKDIGHLVKKVANNPITQIVYPPALANKLALTSPAARQAISTAVTPLLGPLAPTLGPKVLEAASKILYDAKKGSPKALQYVQKLASQAKQGDASSAQLMKLLNVIHTAPVAATPQAAAQLPPTNFAAADLSAMQAAAAGQIAIGCGSATSGDAWTIPPNFAISGAASIPVETAALKVLQRAHAGSQKAKDFIRGVVLASKSGDAQAKRLLPLLMHAAAALKAAPQLPPELAVYTEPFRAATEPTEAGMATSGGSVAYGQDAWNPQPMNVKNFYTISGVDVGPFYGDGVIDADGEVYVVAGEAAEDAEVIFGADGKQFNKKWDGVRWVWNEIRPHLGIRSEQQSFGLRDAQRTAIDNARARAMARLS